MVELTALMPCNGILPITIGETTLSEVDPGRITALMPFRGQHAALTEALQAAHGLGFPEPGQTTVAEGASCVWTARDQAFLMGPAPDDSLAPHAAVTDQSDAWSVVLLAGLDAEDVLARLVPIDLRPAAFPEGAAARTLCQHMSVTICRRAEGLQIMAFRSMARTLAHEISDAMASVAGRRAAG
ncbi:sarcosine oxidase subunit gamma [Antarctobacter heliothermus]|uniref:sarcosine oxidase subunit gamma n=1 Tax=Antarctobacter heliothermus TaxID=74033 RepID=UPI001FE602B4|nr:sarcosine oxidase subunit gamma [Antarctobacter heliothermus]